MITKFSNFTPDTVLYNGKIVTVDSEFSIADAVAIKDGRFTAVGKGKDILTLAGSETYLIDLNGRTVIPGLNDTHNHMSDVGLGMLKVSLEGSTCIADIVRVIQEKVRVTPPGHWITTAMIGEPAISHLLKERRYPTRWDLDPVSPNHPVCIVAPHVYIVNSYALRLGGLGDHAHSPRGGEIGVDPATGKLTGVFYEGPAMSCVKNLLPQVTVEEKIRGLQEACRCYNRVGLTSICEHGIGFDELRAYLELWQKGSLSVRSYLHLLLDSEESSADLARTIKALTFAASPGFGDAFLKVGGVKVFIDGGVGIGTALMREPYVTASGKMCNGVQVVETEKFREIVQLVNQRGLRMAQHCSGGRAVDTVLEVYGKVNDEKSIMDKRFVMVHCQFPTKENFEQIARLGAVVVTQTMFLHTMGLGYIKYLGKELADTAIPLKDWVASGLPVALGSDAPVNSFNPLLGIWHAVTRKEKTTGQVIGGGQRITREEALRCYTIRGAYISFEEHLKGSIEIGKLADLVVLSDDILTCPEDEIRNIQTELTMVDGKVVHGT
jgi:predicted amidohydrolase YtcJ